MKLAADWFDGRQARAQPARVSQADRELVIELDDRQIRHPMAAITWPERTRNGSRILRLPDGSSLHAHEDDAWHRLAAAAGIGDSWIVRLQQSTTGILVALTLLLATGAGLYLWGVPALSSAVVHLVPHAVDERVGQMAIESIEADMFSPSETPPARQQAIAQALALLVARGFGPGEAPGYALAFRASPLGANAFALPGGQIIVTDDMVRLAGDDTEMLLGVLAHEIGHVRRRHGMQLLTRSVLITAITGIAMGDLSSLVASAPLLLGQLGYSRDHEREADEDAIELLLANGISPAVMARFFERVIASRGDEAASSASGFESLLSSHPPSQERIERFEAAAR
ncbi:MAG: M48 family metallopeptidase [Burkholderiaceae bacterium]